MSGSKTPAGDTHFDKIEASYAALDEDENFMSYLTATALPIESDGGGNIDAGLFLNDYHSVDSEFFKKGAKVTGQGGKSEYVGLRAERTKSGESRGRSERQI